MVSWIYISLICGGDHFYWHIVNFPLMLLELFISLSASPGVNDLYYIGRFKVRHSS